MRFNVHFSLINISIIQVQLQSKVSFMIKTLKEFLSPYMIRHIYFTKFQAILRFGILFWGGGE